MLNENARRVHFGSNTGSCDSVARSSDRPRLTAGKRAAAIGVRAMLLPLRTSNGSRYSSRKRLSAWLVADWLKPTRLAARVTWRSLSSASSTTSKLVVVRNAEKASALAKQGAEVVVAELHDQRALERAFAGAEGVYLLSPPDLQARSFISERKQLTQEIVDTLVRARVPHVLLLSSIGAERAAGTGPIVTVHPRLLRHTRELWFFCARRVQTL